MSKYIRHFVTDLSYARLVRGVGELEGKRFVLDRYLSYDHPKANNVDEWIQQEVEGVTEINEDHSQWFGKSPLAEYNDIS